MEERIQPPNYRYPPPREPRSYSPPPDGIRKLPQAPDGYQQAAFLVLKQPRSSVQNKKRRKRTLFTSDFSTSLPDLWNPNETPYGTFRPSKSTTNTTKNRNRTNHHKSRARPDSAVSSSSSTRTRRNGQYERNNNTSSRPQSARSSGQESAASAYGTVQKLPNSVRRAKSANSNSNSYSNNNQRKNNSNNNSSSSNRSQPNKQQSTRRERRKRPQKKWLADNDQVLINAENRRQALIASKVAHTKSFNLNRGKRVNSEGDFVDGVVEDLRPKQFEDLIEQTSSNGRQIHRPSRGKEEVNAEAIIHQDDMSKQQMGGNDEAWRTPRSDMNTIQLHKKMDKEEEENEENEENEKVSSEEEEEEDYSEIDEEEEEVQETKVTIRRLGPECMRDLPEGRTSWNKMLRGYLPSDLLWKDLGHTIPLMKLELSHLNVEDHLLFILASDGSKHRGIIKLHLKNCTRITDKGIVALESCKRIRHLDVSNCHRLTDIAFVSFAKTHADLSRVRLTGCKLVTDRGIGALAVGCRHLIIIEAAGLSLGDVALRAFAKQSSVPFSAKLQHVDLSGCESATDGSMMSVMTGLGGAQHISIANASLVTDVSMAPLSRSSFRSLRALDITNLNVGDAGVAWIAEGCRRGLRELNLRGCKSVTDVGIIALSETCTNLTCLSIAECVEVTDVAIDRIMIALGPSGVLNPYRKYTAKPKVKKAARSSGKRRGGKLHKLHEEDKLEDKYIDIPSGLRMLDLTDCLKLTDRSLESIGQYCQALETLVLVGVNNITDVGLLHLGKMRTRTTPTSKPKFGQKQIVTVSHNPLINLNVSGRFTVSNIGLNTFFGTARVTDIGIARMIKQGCGKRIVTLDLTGSGFVGDKTLKALGKGASMLKHLALSGCARITDVGVAALFSVSISMSGNGCIALETLNMAGCPRIGDGALIALGKGTTSDSLRKLNLFKCRNITDHGIRALANCTSLEELNLRTCTNVTDGGLIAFASDPRGMDNEMYPKAPRLLSLNIAGLPDITPAGVTVVANRFTRLGRLDATGCVNVERRHLSRLVALRDGILQGARLSPHQNSVSLVPAAPGLGLAQLHSFIALKTKQHLCAIQIQNAWNALRSFKARLKKMIEDKINKRRWRKTAILVLQRTVARGVAGRMKAKRRVVQKGIEDKARINIQKCWRGHLGRGLMKAHRRKLSAIAALRCFMAIIIQRMLRGLFGRIKYKTKFIRDQFHTLRLQKWIREMWAKDEARTLAQTIKRIQRIRNRAAKRIQLAWKGEQERAVVHAAFVRLRQGTLTLQRWTRGTISRWKTKKWKIALIHACCVVQSAFRNHSSRMVRYMLQRAKNEQNKLEYDSATTIQTSLVRPWFARKRIKLQIIKHHSATLFQSAWRYYQNKRSSRRVFAMARLKKREEAIIEAKARVMYAQWRVEDDAKPDSIQSRQRIMLETGAAMVIQKLYRHGLIVKNLRLLGQYKFHRSAIQIQSALRGFWARGYVNWRMKVMLKVTTHISKWWRQFPITYAYRNVKKIKEAERRRLALIKKKKLIQKSKERRLAHLLERTKLRAIKLIQFEYRAYVVRRIAWETAEALRIAKEEEIKAIEDFRILADKERKERKTIKGKLKAFKRFITDPKAVKKHLTPDKRQVDHKINQVKAMFDSKLKEQLVRNEFESLMFSIQSRQKEAIAQTGVIDLALTVGEDEYKSFRLQQNTKKSEGKPFFETSRVDLHSTHTKFSQGQRVPIPRFIFIWTMTAHKRTSHIITDIQILKHPQNLNSLKHRTYLDAAEESGWTLKWHPKCNFEIRYHLRGRHMIRALEPVSNFKQQAKLLNAGWEEFCYNDKNHTHQGEEKIIGFDEYSEPLNFAEFGYDDGTKLYIKHAMPKKNAQAMEAQYEAVKKSDGSYADISQDSMDHESMTRLLDQVEFAGYSAIDVDKLRTHFNKMDADKGGTVDVDEFFAYIKENRKLVKFLFLFLVFYLFLVFLYFRDFLKINLVLETKAKLIHFLCFICS